MSGWQCASTHLEGLALSTHMVVGVSHSGLGWHVVLLQLQRPRLAARAVLRLQEVGREQEGTRSAGISK